MTWTPTKSGTSSIVALRNTRTTRKNRGGMVRREIRRRRSLRPCNGRERQGIRGVPTGTERVARSDHQKREQGGDQRGRHAPAESGAGERAQGNGHALPRPQEKGGVVPERQRGGDHRRGPCGPVGSRGGREGEAESARELP